MAGIVVPDPLILKGDLAKNYQVFEEQFTKFFASKKYLHDVPESEKITFFLTTIGKDARELYKTFNIPSDDDSVTLNSVMERFKVYCDSFKDNSVYYSYKFYSRNQQKGESFECYLKAVFELAKSCHFNYDRDTIERIVRDKLILGLSSSNIRDEIFNKGFTKLEEIVNYCLAKDKQDESDGKEEKMEEDSHIVKETEKADEGAVKVEKAEEENSKKKDDDESENDKNSGNRVTSSNDVLTTSSEPVEQDIKMEISNDYDDSILEKGEVSTSSFFDNALENNAASPQGSDLQNNVLKQEVFDTDSSSIVSESHSSQKETHSPGNSIPNKKSENENSDLEIITIDSSDSGDDKNRKSIPNKKTKMVNAQTIAPPKIPLKKLFKCGNCKKEFTVKGALFAHMNSCIMNIRGVQNKIFKCSLCSNLFGSQKNLDDHFATHRTSERYSCDVCGKNFDRESKLSGHKAVSHNATDIVYACSKCPKKFSDGDSLRVHEVEHRTSRSSLIKRTYRSSLKNKTSRPSSENNISMSSSGNSSSFSDEFPYSCALCHNHYKTYEDLANHKHF